MEQKISGTVVDQYREVSYLNASWTALSLAVGNELRKVLGPTDWLHAAKSGQEVTICVRPWSNDHQATMQRYAALEVTSIRYQTNDRQVEHERASQTQPKWYAVVTQAPTMFPR